MADFVKNVGHHCDMCRNLILVGCLFWVQLALPTNAGDLKCATSLSQTGLNICAKARAEKSEEELARILAELREKLDAEEKTLLQEAENAWEIYRDKTCEFVGHATTGGSVHSMVVTNCYEEITSEHASRLERQMTCDEGDLACIGR